MPRAIGLPKANKKTISKIEVLENLKRVDDDDTRRQRVLEIESKLRNSITTHINYLPAANTPLGKLNTNPFVLLVYSLKEGYENVSQLERDIIPAKLFSSMETAAGRIIQEVVMPVYSWNIVDSEMHSERSVIDISRDEPDRRCVVTIKSGPRCLNDEMSKDIAEDIVTNAKAWSDEAEKEHIEFVYGVLYGTEKSSNKKDWHILRNITEMKGPRYMKVLPDNKWSCSFENRGILVEVQVKIGMSFWEYIGDQLTFYEVACALIRSCIKPSSNYDTGKVLNISDLEKIISLSDIPPNYNISLLQRSQLEWMFFYVRHFCDVLV